MVVVNMTKYIVGHALKAITFYHLATPVKFVHATLFEGVLQLKLMTKPRLFKFKW